MSFRITPQTRDQLKTQLLRRGSGVGVRVSVIRERCSGLAFKLAFVDQVPGDCHPVTIDGLHLFADYEAMIYLAGTELDLASHSPCHLFAGEAVSTNKACHQQTALSA